MLYDERQWNRGIALLSSFAQHIHAPFDEGHVEQFHNIISTLEGASDENLSEFKIALDRLRPTIASAQRASFTGRHGRIRYSEKKECDASYFQSQVHGLASYLLREHRPMNEEEPYESLTDFQLQDEIINRKIKPRRVENDVFDRKWAIEALLKHDREAHPAASTVIHIHDSNVIHSSPGASIAQNIGGAKGDELRKILTNLKQIAAAHGLASEDRAEMNIDIGTIELHINAPHPNNSVIKASLESAQRILENAAGTVLGAGAVVGIKAYLGLP
jgi:hypothetical protein